VRHLQITAFDSVETAASIPSDQRASKSKTRDVEILFKPRPLYTKEARSKRLEGEVVLEILFTTSGEVRVLRIVQGLGEGLDESAVRAAERIRFKPAETGGAAIDAVARVRIQFQLAS
jgi:TonB family protein